MEFGTAFDGAASAHRFSHWARPIRKGFYEAEMNRGEGLARSHIVLILTRRSPALSNRSEFP
jgi:hypothetical protein